MNKLFLTDNNDFVFQPEDFANPAILRRLVGVPAIKLYAQLRVVGFGTVDSWIAALGKKVYGHPEALQKAAEQFETAPYFEVMCEEVAAELGEETIKRELQQRCVELAAFTMDSAMYPRTLNAQRGEQPEQASRFTSTRDEEAFQALIKDRRNEQDKAEMNAMRFQNAAREVAGASHYEVQ